MTPRNIALCLMVIYLTVQVQSEEPGEVLSLKLVNYFEGNDALRMFPKKTSNVSVNVDVKLHLFDIKEADSKRNEVEIAALMSLTWNSGITFSPELFNNLTKIRISVSKIWVPDINPIYSEIEFQELVGDRKAILTLDGSVFWAIKVKIRVMCNVNEFQLLTNTTCKMRFTSWTHNGLDIMLNEDPLFTVDEYFADSNYQLLGARAENKVKRYSCCPGEPYPEHQFIFSFRKKLF